LGSYRIFETETFQKYTARLATAALGRLTQKLQQQIYPRLRMEPHFGPNIKRLRNWQPPTWRYRIGSWRFFYEIDEQKQIVFMIAADHRSEAY